MTQHNKILEPTRPFNGTLFQTVRTSVADPDPAFHFDTDPDPAFQFDTDPDLTI
jgi:hypothetical protein